MATAVAVYALFLMAYVFETSAQKEFFDALLCQFQIANIGDVLLTSRGRFTLCEQTSFETTILQYF